MISILFPFSRMLNPLRTFRSDCALHQISDLTTTFVVTLVCHILFIPIYHAWCPPLTNILFCFLKIKPTEKQMVSLTRFQCKS